jgi:hypothetical protein
VEKELLKNIVLLNNTLHAMYYLILSMYLIHNADRLYDDKKYITAIIFLIVGIMGFLLSSFYKTI